MTETKVVQTELSLPEYEALKKVLERNGLTLKDAIRDAILQWTSENYPLDDDSFFQLKPVKFKIKVKSEEIDHFLYTGGNP
jgi:hypothetical protein